MKKRFLALGLVGMMMLGALAGCGGDKPTEPAKGADKPAVADPAPAAEKIKVGFSMPTRDQFWTSVEKAAVTQAETDAVDLSVYDSNYDISLQISHVQTCASDNYDAMIVGLVNNDSAADVLSVAGDMKVVFVNRQPDLAVLNENVVYVGTDENLYGDEQGKFLAEHFKAAGKTDINAVVFMGELGLDNVIKRTQSVKDSLKENGINATYVFEDTAKWDRATAMDKFVQFMGTGKAYDVVICNNDEMALGVIEAMKTTGSKEILCPVVGIDATDVGCQAVQEGSMACTVFQDPVAQGGGTIECAVKLVKGEANDKLVDFYYNIEPKLVTKDNVADFIK